MDRSIKTDHLRTTTVHDIAGVDTDSAVRTYNHSPNTINVQLRQWLENKNGSRSSKFVIANAYLSIFEAERLIRNLREAIKDAGQTAPISLA